VNTPINPIELGGFWLPRAGSTIAHDIDYAWTFVTVLSIVFFVLVVGAMLLFVVRYRRRSDDDRTSAVSHNLKLEAVWTIIPTVLCFFLFVIGFRGYVNASMAPANAFEIRAVAQKWSWAFQYPNGFVSLGEMHVPRGRPVKLIMSSKDVVHSFFVPIFRVKQDVVPGTYTTLWFEATEAGKTAILCTEYCGTGHSDMLANLVVDEPEAFDRWLEKSGDDPAVSPVEKGKQLYVKATCEACHSTDGSPKVGPTFKGLFGRSATFNDEKTLKIDENYVRESLLNPQARIVKGFQPVMPTFQGQLSDKQVDYLIAYLKTL
jgi:cytochrome c oxidase subunit 2